MFQLAFLVQETCRKLNRGFSHRLNILFQHVQLLHMLILQIFLNFMTGFTESLESLLPFVIEPTDLFLMGQSQSFELLLAFQGKEYQYKYFIQLQRLKTAQSLFRAITRVKFTFRRYTVTLRVYKEAKISK